MISGSSAFSKTSLNIWKFVFDLLPWRPAPPPLRRLPDAHRARALCSQQCRSMRKKASWYQSPGDAPCLRVSIFPWLLFFMTSLVPSNRGDYWSSALFPVAQSPDTVQEKSISGAERWKELGKHLSLLLHPKVHSYFLPLCNPLLLKPSLEDFEHYFASM